MSTYNCNTSELSQSSNCFFTHSSDTTQQITTTNSSQHQVFSTSISLHSARTPLSVLAPPMATHCAYINSTASLLSTLPLSNPACPSSLCTSSLTSLPSTQSIHAIDITQSYITAYTNSLTAHTHFLHYTLVFSPSLEDSRSHARLNSTYNSFYRQKIQNP